MPERALRWGVVGGGMLGLTLAHRLRRRGQDVTIIEAAPALGGLASAWQLGDVVWDRYYHVITQFDAELMALLDELGLDSALRWAGTRTLFYTGSAMYPLDNAIDFWRLPVLGIVDKARLAATILYGSSITNGRRLESVDARTWLTRYSGRSTYENLWLPLLRSKLGDNHRHASAAYIWSVIRRFYGAREGNMKKEMFGYVDGGYATVISAFHRATRESGIDFMLGAPVTSIRATDGGVKVVTDAESPTFDRVVATCASPIAAELCHDLTSDEKERHRNVLYQGIVCVSLLLTRPLGNAYLTYIVDETIPFTTVIEMSSLVGVGAFAGKHLVYLPKYVPTDDPLLALDDDTVIERFTEALARMYPDLTHDQIDTARVSRTRYVLAISTLNYSDALPPIRTTVPGLYVVNSSQIVNASLAVNDTVKLANEKADELLQEALP